MTEITLLYSTGHAKADAIIRGAIGILERIFPQRIGGYYLVGSYEDGTAIPTSDLDIVPIFRGSITEAEEAAYWEVIKDLDLISPIPLGFGLRNEQDSFTQGGVGIKIGSKLLYGEDVRDQIPLWSLDFYLQYMIGAHINGLIALRGNVEPLHVPLTYPDPDSAFYGYDQPGGGNDQERTSSTLFGNVQVIASTLTTLKTGEYNASKSRSYAFYKRHINDEWSDFLEAMYTHCKMKWHYRVPADAADQQILRTLCERVLAFENHFVEQIRPYLLEQREAGNPWAEEQLSRVIFER